ncbi:hypothetical protein GYMLUDRAFT_50242 [Collybiopsis luxurians FD-317 M1]|uniref:Uncharacterized protein n=1 Tax=Collybiopsis luxurians FD-317 M1 TaxID=944289 RepID=A0A0D0BQP8_9AGAR|nr:hypothetical protein GYMLUDRAFT_50242 [Collybiopsis luxurians FD-317 M1]
MLLVARVAALCCILAGLLAVTASPLAIMEHDRRAPGGDLVILDKKYHHNQQGPAIWLMVRQGFTLLPNARGQKHYDVYDIPQKLSTAEKKPEITTFLCRLQFPTDGSKSKDEVFTAIKALKPTSVEEFITDILGIVQKYIKSDVTPKEKWLKAMKEPGQAEAGASGSQASGSKAPESNPPTQPQEPPKKSNIHDVLSSDPGKPDIQNAANPQQPAAGASGSQGSSSNPPNAQQAPKKSNIHDVLSSEPKKSDIHKVMNRWM